MSFLVQSVLESIRSRFNQGSDTIRNSEHGEPDRIVSNPEYSNDEITSNVNEADLKPPAVASGRINDASNTVPIKSEEVGINNETRKSPLPEKPVKSSIEVTTSSSTTSRNSGHCEPDRIVSNPGNFDYDSDDAHLKPAAVSSDGFYDRSNAVPIKSEEVAANYGTRKSSRIKSVTVSPEKPVKWEWTESTDQIVRDAVERFMEDTKGQSKTSLKTVWDTLALQFKFKITPDAISRRWTTHLDPKINHAPMTRQDNLQLWEGHALYGSWWGDINDHLFGGTRPLLDRQWKTKKFKEFVRKEFGPEAYGEANRRNIESCPSKERVKVLRGEKEEKSVRKKSSARKPNPVSLKQEKVARDETNATKSNHRRPTRKRACKDVESTSSAPIKKARQESDKWLYEWTKAKDQMICDAVDQYLKDGVIGNSLWTKLGKQFGVPAQAVTRRWWGRLNPHIDRSPMTRKDDLRLWEGHRMFGKKWQDISDEYFESTRWGETLRNRWKTQEFQNTLKEEYGRFAFQKENKSVHYVSNHYKQPEKNSMDRFGNDILYRVASFLPSLRDLISFCRTSKQSHLIMKDECLSERLYRSLFMKKFGAEELAALHFSWKERWVCAFDFKRAFKNIKESRSGGFAVWPHTIGVIQPPAYEQSAVLYDNPRYDLNGDASHGYFGLQSLNLAKPPNASNEWESPLILRGDFNGVRLFSSLGALEDHSNPNRFLSLGADEEFGQVLTMIINDAIDQDATSPCCFLGYASGKVSAMTCSLAEDGTKYQYSLSSWHAHSSEVTSLAVVNNPRPTLFSACCDGDIYYYPSPTQWVKAFSNMNNCPILSMAYTEVVDKEGNSSRIIITGDQSGTIQLLSANLQDNEFSCFHRKLGRGNHPVTVTNIITHDDVKLLVTGNTNGDIQFWRINMNKGSKLNLVGDYPGQHTGAVEMCRMIAGVLVTSGGNDGRLFGFDPSSCDEIGSLFCHRGKSILLPHRTRRLTMTSCAVSAFIPSASKRKLITLCRDGDMADWTFSTAE